MLWLDLLQGNYLQEYEKMDKSEEGLKPNIQDMMATQTYRTFADIV